MCLVRLLKKVRVFEVVYNSVGLDAPFTTIVGKSPSFYKFPDLD